MVCMLFSLCLHLCLCICSWGVTFILNTLWYHQLITVVFLLFCFFDLQLFWSRDFEGAMRAGIGEVMLRLVKHGNTSSASLELLSTRSLKRILFILYVEPCVGRCCTINHTLIFTFLQTFWILSFINLLLHYAIYFIFICWLRMIQFRSRFLGHIRL